MTAAKNISASNAASERQIRRRRKKLALKILENAVLLVVAAIILFPILWMVMTAFKSPKFVYAYTIWFPPTFENFREVFNPRWLIGEKIINSAIISLLDRHHRDPDRGECGLCFLAASVSV